ncbi:MAG: YkgJ family cysteine cluster protein [Halobacteriaceae archaeon]
METHCEGCAGCCLDWRDRAPPGVALDHERRGRYDPLDDAYNLAVLTRDDARQFVAAGEADALTARLFEAEGSGVEIDGVNLAAIDGRPAFLLGLRTPPKPVAPFDTDPGWTRACTFLDPQTLQCRIHDEGRYPRDCADYPGHDLALDAETECERVEAAWGGHRLLDDDAPADLPGLALGPEAVGWKVFAHPEPDALRGSVGDVADHSLDRETRATFVAAAAASAPGSVAVDRDRYETARETARRARSWAGRAAADWDQLAGAAAPDPSLSAVVEDDRGAPPTPGWDADDRGGAGPSGGGEVS